MYSTNPSNQIVGECLPILDASNKFICQSEIDIELRVLISGFSSLICYATLSLSPCLSYTLVTPA